MDGIRFRKDMEFGEGGIDKSLRRIWIISIMDQVSKNILIVDRMKEIKIGVSRERTAESKDEIKKLEEIWGISIIIIIVILFTLLISRLTIIN